jgi:carbamoyl-phosphate synthase large subunit
MAMRRVLEAGTTVRAEAGDFPELRAYAESIARALRPVGPLNVQLREVDGRPVAFELNVRFSGTTPVRARLGFNEVEATLRHLLRGEPLSLPLVAEGTMVRYWNEIYPARDSGSATVEDWGMER